MSDTFTTVRRTGCLGNIANSFVGAIFGVLLFFVAFPVIWIGEGRTNMAQVAETSVSASPAQIDPANEGRLVAVTGSLESDPVGDSPYLQPGAYLQLTRTVEMFAWVEDERSESRDELGGGTTTRTTYTYTKQWTSSPESSSSFAQPSGHQNPSLPIEGATVTATGGAVGAYQLDLENMELPSGDRLTLRPEILGADHPGTLASNYLFQGRGAIDSPQVGDVRISYAALPAGSTLTVFAAQRGSSLKTFYTAKKDALYRALEGDREAAIKQLSIEDTITDWIIRIVTLVMMWAGLGLLLGPINAMLGVLPILKQAGGCLTSIITFVVAFVIWSVTVLIAIIAHNLVLLLIVLALIAAGGYFFVRRQQASARLA